VASRFQFHLVDLRGLVSESRSFAQTSRVLGHPAERSPNSHQVLCGDRPRRDWPLGCNGQQESRKRGGTKSLEKTAARVRPAQRVGARTSRRRRHCTTERKGARWLAGGLRRPLGCIGACRRVLKHLVDVPAKAALGLIALYQRFLSPLKGTPTCRYLPSCSSYARDAVSHRGVVLGLVLTVYRLLRCNPFSSGGYDPVRMPKREA